MLVIFRTGCVIGFLALIATATFFTAQEFRNGPRFTHYRAPSQSSAQEALGNALGSTLIPSGTLAFRSKDPRGLAQEFNDVRIERSADQKSGVFRIIDAKNHVICYGLQSGTSPSISCVRGE